MSRQKGTTLIEILLVLTLAGLLGSLVLPTVRGSSKLAARTRAAQGDQRDDTALLALTMSDLGSALASRVSTPNSHELHFDRPVGEAPVCSFDAGGVVVPRSAWTGSRLAEASRDVVNILADLAAGVWTTSPITAIGSASCPDGTAAWRWSVSTVPGTPAWVRVSEPVRLAVYAAADTSWLGMASRLGGGSIQPIAGPVAPSELQFTLLGNILELDLGGGSGYTWHIPLEAHP